MASSFCLMLGGQPADDTIMQLLASTEVEESMDMPSAIELTLPVSRSIDGELSYISDARFAPLASLSVVTSASGGADDAAPCGPGEGLSPFGAGSQPGGAQCIFDGYVLSQKIHLETGTANSTLTVWGQDASWLMNQTEKIREWVDVTEIQVAASIFGDYGIVPSDDNQDGNAPTYTEDTHSLMQRGSDIAFLRMLARRSGKICRIACADRPGEPTGFFAAPKLDGAAVANLAINDNTNWTVSALDIDWDVTRPTTVQARTIVFDDATGDPAIGDTDDSGLPPLADRTLADFVGQPMTVLLATAADTAGALAERARAVLRDSGWFVRCEGEADVERLGLVMRAGMLVNLVGIGALHSGKWIVWTVRHRITEEKHTMRFTLLRNAIGPAPAGGGMSTLAGAA